MKASFKRMNLTYEIRFEATLFELPGSSLDLLKAIQANLSSIVMLSASNMNLVSGASVLDTRVHISMFNGAGQAEVSAENSTISFSNLQTSNDLDLCKECILRIEKALTETLERLEIQLTEIRSDVFLELDELDQSASSYLGSLSNLGGRFRSDAFQSATLHPAINLALDHSEEKWSANVNAFWDRVSESSLTLFFRAWHLKDGKFSDLKSRFEHLDQLADGFLNDIELEVTNF